MELKSYVEGELASSYDALEGLLDLLSEDDLDWKPASGTNWMTVGQLLEHLAGCGGLSFQGLAEGAFAEMPAEAAEGGGLPPAAALPGAASLADARARIRADRALAERVLAVASEADLASKPAPVWWDPRDRALGVRMLDMILHLNQHKGQLFYYLKLMGHDVNTMHLYGI